MNAQIIFLNAQASVSGGGNTIFLGPGTDSADDVTTLTGTYYGDYGGFDRVLGSGGHINFQNADASISGGGNTITMSNGFNNAILFSTDGDADTITSDTSAIVLDGAQAAISGIYNSVQLLGLGDIIKLENAGGYDDNVTGSNADITVLSSNAEIDGGGNYIHQYGGTSNITLSQTNGVRDYVDNIDTADEVIGQGEVELYGAQAAVQGDNVNVRFVSYYNAVNSVELTAFQDFYGYTFGPSGTVNGSYGDITVNSGVSDVGVGGNVTVNGGDDNIVLGHDNSLTLNGSMNSIDLSGQTNVFNTVAGFNSTDVITFSTSTFANWQALQAAISQQGGDTVIASSTCDLVLHNVNASGLTSSEFKFV